MKTKRILAMLMAVCMLAACSMVVSAEEVESETTIVDNYLDTTTPSGANKWSTLTATHLADLPEGVPTNVAYGIGKDRHGERINPTYDRAVRFTTATNIPVQKYIFSVWYKTNINEQAIVRLQYTAASDYDGSGGPTLGKKSFTAALPNTNEKWEQFVMIWDATQDIQIIDERAMLMDTENNPITPFQGCAIFIGKLPSNLTYSGVSNAAAYIEFCNPVLAAMPADYFNVFQATEIKPFAYGVDEKGDPTDSITVEGVTTTYYYNKDDKGGDVKDLYNFLGLVNHSVTGDSEVVFKSASTDLSTVGATQVLLTAYDETADVAKLTDIEIVDATTATGGIRCTIPAAFAGKTVKAYFWGSNGSLKPLAAPVTATVAAIASEE